MSVNNEQQGVSHALGKTLIEKLKEIIEKSDRRIIKAMRTRARRQLERRAGLEKDSSHFSTLLLSDYLLDEELLLDRQLASENSRLGHWIRHFELELKKYSIHEWKPCVHKDLPVSLKRAYHLVVLAKKAAQQDGKLTSFTLALPQKMWEKKKKAGSNENLIRDVNYALKKISPDFIFSFEIDEDEENPHLHGVLVQPVGVTDKELAEKMIKAVGKAGNNAHQVKLKECYSQRWLSYMCKDHDGIQTKLGRSPYNCPRHLSSAAIQLYNEVRGEVMQYHGCSNFVQAKSSDREQSTSGVSAKTDTRPDVVEQSETLDITGLEDDSLAQLEESSCSYNSLIHDELYPVEEHQESMNSRDDEDAVSTEDLSFTEEELRAIDVYLKFLRNQKLEDDEAEQSVMEVGELSDEEEASILREVDEFMHSTDFELIEKILLESRQKI